MSETGKAELWLQIDTSDLTPEEVDLSTRQLLAELKEMDVDSAELVKAGPAPAGTKSSDPVAMGMIAIATVPTVLPKVVEGIHLWAMRRSNRNIKFKGKIGKDAIEFEGSLKDLQELLKTIKFSEK